jgi:creatinine amidohydrolase
MKVMEEYFDKWADKSIFSDTMVEMNCQDVQKKAHEDCIILFPISVVEEHGPHLDLSPYIYGANIYCKLIKYKLEKDGVKSIIAPRYYWGINNATGKFPGSFTLKPETFELVLTELFECLIKWGFTKIFAFNIHGDSLHCSTIVKALDKIRSIYKVHAYELFDLSRKLDISHEAFRNKRETRFSPDRHAGATETAFMNSYHPETVNRELAKQLNPQSSFDEPLGYLGDPASFQLENEIEASDRISDYYLEVINAFLRENSNEL